MREPKNKWTGSRSDYTNIIMVDGVSGEIDMTSRIAVCDMLSAYSSRMFRLGDKHGGYLKGIPKVI